MAKQQNVQYQTIKRGIDFLCAFIAIILFLPLYILISIIIFCTIGTPVIYQQERLGKNFKPFQIYKFRTMTRFAEQTNQPQLSSENDERIIGVGKLLRKYRLDELPQFVNVLKGDMSIVGPRPERAFYIKQLQEQVPNYNNLFTVKPGITSSGMVEYGYASNIHEMKTRAKYDISYIETISFTTDYSVLLKTFLVIINGKGK